MHLCSIGARENFSNVNGVTLGIIMSTKQTITLALAILTCIPFTKAHAEQWDGLFLGINAGVAQSNAKYQTGPDNRSWFLTMGETGGMWNRGNRDKSRFSPIGGLSVAYNSQVDFFVFGAELGLNALNSKLDHTGTYSFLSSNRNYTYLQKTNVEGLYTLRGRAGYAFDDSLLSATAGIAATLLKTGLAYSDNYTGASQYTAARSETNPRVGWTVGLAYQHMMPDNIVFKAEFTYVDLGKTDFTTPVKSGGGTVISRMNFSSQVHLNIFTIGIEKKF